MNADEKIKEIIRLMEHDDSVDALADSIKWAKNLYRARIPAGQPSLLKRVVAVLQAELSPGGAAFGERSASASKERQMLFRAGDAAIELRISGTGKSRNVRGQMIGEGYEDCRVSLSGRDVETARPVSDLGEFDLGKVSPGAYTMTITTKTEEIVVENIEIS
jgi:hypothetical protein